MAQRNKKDILTIGIDYYSADQSHPADRRRYQSINHHHLERLAYDRLSAFDVVIINISTNFAVFFREFDKVEDGCKPVLIFDYCDFTIYDSAIKQFLRDVSSKLKNGFLSKSPSSLLWRALREADHLICGSEAQKAILQDYNDNIAIISDCFYTDFGDMTSQVISNPDKVNIVWEGLASGNQEIFSLIGEIDTLLARTDIDYEFIVITDLKFSYLSNIFPIQTSRILSQKITTQRYQLHQWSIENLFAYARTENSLSIIPIGKANRRMWMKPANKIGLLHGLGMKILASPTPAVCAFAADEPDVTLCHSADDFVAAIVAVASGNIIPSPITHNLETHNSQVKKWSELLAKF